MTFRWHRSKDGYWFGNAVSGKMLAQKNEQAKLWVWDAIQDQEEIIVPDSHRATGTSATLKEAKVAAEHALQRLIKSNT